MSNSREAERSGISAVAIIARELGIYVDLDLERLELTVASENEWIVWPGMGGWYIRPLSRATSKRGRLVAPFYASSKNVMHAVLKHDFEHRGSTGDNSAEQSLLRPHDVKGSETDLIDNSHPISGAPLSSSGTGQPFQSTNPPSLLRRVAAISLDTCGTSS